MTKITLAAVALTAAGASLAVKDSAFARGPSGMEAEQSLLVLAKETQHTDLDLKDFPFGLKEGRTENVRLNFEQTIEIPEEDESVSIRYVMTMPWMEVEKDGDEKVTIRFADTQKLDLEVDGPEEETVTITADMTSDDTVMTFARDGDRMSYEGGSKGFTAVVETPEAVADEVSFAYKLGGKNLRIEGTGAAEQDFSDMRKLDIEYDYVLDSMTFDFDITPKNSEEEMPPIAVNGETGELKASGKIGEGVLTGGGVMTDMTLNITKPTPMELFFGRFETDMEMPTEASDEPQKVRYLIKAEEIEIDEAIWSMADPGKVFPRQLNKLTVDLQMMAMMYVSLLDPEAVAKAEESGMPPMMPTSVKINSIAFDGLGLDVAASGEGDMASGAPQASGLLTVKGLKDFVDNAVSAGMFGEQEAMMATGMAEQFGKPGDDGELVFEVETKDGMVMVNGTPVAPLPQ